MIEIGQATDVGMKRAGRPNEDSLGVVQGGGFFRRPPLLIVADGMGGYSGGPVASRLVVDTISAEYRKFRWRTNYSTLLYSSVLKAHEALHARAALEPDLAQMGSTVVVAVVQDHLVHLVNVGDSRAYLFTKNEMLQLSWDHSLVGQKIREGEITVDEARIHPQRNILTMSVNAQRLAVEPYVTSHEFKADDVIVLCSDGLWGPVSEDEMREVVKQMPPQQAAQRLVEMANANMGPDNITVIVARQTS